MHQKTALITGGTSGIGKAIAHEFVSQGIRVILSGRNEERGKTTQEELQKSGAKATFIRANVANQEEVDDLFERIRVDFGRLDYACNNAGTDEGIGALTADTEEADFDKQIQVNLKGVWRCMKHELQVMALQESGVIVNISSVNGLGGTLGAAAYSAAKHGVIGLSKSAALEYAVKNIRVNVVCPGLIQTPMLDRVMKQQNPDQPEAVKEHMKSLIPMNRIGKAEEIAQITSFLCSESATYMTGQVIVPDGGLTAMFR